MNNLRTIRLLQTLTLQVLRYMQPANTTSMQYADNLYAKSYKMAAVYNESMLDDIFIEKGNCFIRHSLREYFTTYPHTDVADMASKAKYFLETQNGTVKQSRFQHARRSNKNLFLGATEANTFHSPLKQDHRLHRSVLFNERHFNQSPSHPQSLRKTIDIFINKDTCTVLFIIIFITSRPRV